MWNDWLFLKPVLPAPAESGEQQAAGGKGPPAAEANTRIGPAAKKLLQECGLSLDSITPSGPRGIVTKGDVLAAISGGQKPAKQQQQQPQQQQPQADKVSLLRPPPGLSQQPAGSAHMRTASSEMPYCPLSGLNIQGQGLSEGPGPELHKLTCMRGFLTAPAASLGLENTHLRNCASQGAQSALA